MTGKIFRAICFVATGVLLAAILLFMGVLYGYFSELQLEQLASETRICAQGVEQNGATFFDALDTGDVRVTWVAADGSVLYDSKKDAETMPRARRSRRHWKAATVKASAIRTRLRCTAFIRHSGLRTARSSAFRANSGAF